FAAITGAGQHAVVCDVSGRKNTDHAHPTGAAENMEPVFSTPAMVAAGNARSATMAAFIQRLKNVAGVMKKIGWCLTLFFFAASVQALTLTDDSGQAVRLSAPAQRIITLTPHATELMFAVGAGQQVVGAVDYSDYPADAAKIPRVGGYSGLNIEAILALQPDLIIYWPEGNPAREIQRLKQLKMPLYASDPNSFADIARSLEHYGEISGNVAKGQQAATQFRQRLNALQQRYAGAG